MYDLESGIRKRVYYLGTFRGTAPTRVPRTLVLDAVENVLLDNYNGGGRFGGSSSNVQLDAGRLRLERSSAVFSRAGPAERSRTIEFRP